MWGGEEGRCGVVRREVCVEDEGRFGMVVERSGDVEVRVWRVMNGGGVVAGTKRRIYQ